jgi:hypothetical protein
MIAKISSFEKVFSFIPRFINFINSKNPDKASTKLKSSSNSAIKSQTITFKYSLISLEIGTFSFISFFISKYLFIDLKLLSIFSIVLKFASNLSKLNSIESLYFQFIKDNLKALYKIFLSILENFSSKSFKV